MPKLAELIFKAEADKPKMGEPCNNCGWCCLTEVCPVGLELVGSVIPCALLREEGGKHYCNLVKIENQYGTTDILKDLGINTGCDAATQIEQINGEGV